MSFFLVKHLVHKCLYYLDMSHKFNIPFAKHWQDWWLITDSIGDFLRLLFMQLPWNNSTRTVLDIVWYYKQMQCQWMKKRKIQRLRYLLGKTISECCWGTGNRIWLKYWQPHFPLHSDDKCSFCYIYTSFGFNFYVWLPYIRKTPSCHSGFRTQQTALCIPTIILV